MAAKKSQSQTPQIEHILCAFAGCPTNSIVKQKLKTGWANLCEGHAMRICQERADAYCKALGLFTVEDKRTWLRDNKVMVKRRPLPKIEEPEEEGVPF